MSDSGIYCREAKNPFRSLLLLAAGVVDEKKAATFGHTNSLFFPASLHQGIWHGNRSRMFVNLKI